MKLWRMESVVVLSVLLLIASVGSSGASQPCRCPGRSASEVKVVTGDDARLVEVEASGLGKRYEVGPPADSIALVHVYGTPYELGRAHGSLLATQIRSMYSAFFRYLEDRVMEALHLSVFPDILGRRLARFFINFGLDATYMLTWVFTPARFHDEIAGLADGANVNYRDVARIQMIPELTQASCSMLGAWASATPSGGLYQLRALDWNTDAPIRDYPAIIFYHPSDGNPFAIFTWAGFIGCITGFSGKLGISEKVWVGHEGPKRRSGMPWHFVLRDLLQYKKSIEQARSYLQNVERTCPILLGIGSASDNQFVLFGYSSSSLQLYDDKNFTLVTSGSMHGDEHRGVVFVDKYVQPSHDCCMKTLVERHYGEINEIMLIESSSLHESGNLHIAIYDFSGDAAYFSWAVFCPNTATVVPAYQRSFVKLTMSSLLYENFSADTTSTRKFMAMQ